MQQKVWFITGAAKGLGLSISREALASGYRVVATGRVRDDIVAALGPENDNLLILALDVTDPAAALAGSAAAITKFGQIDVLVNNAGQAQLGWFETIPDEDVRAQFETNLFGAMNVTRAVLPHMRAQQDGVIVTISSVNGLVSMPGGSVYAASKFALEGWVEGLAGEVAPLGIASLVVEPGMMRTNFLDPSAARQGGIEIADYAEAVAAFRGFIAEANWNQPNDPDDLARIIVAQVTAGTPSQRLVFGKDAIDWARDKAVRLMDEIAASDAMG